MSPCRHCRLTLLLPVYRGKVVQAGTAEELHSAPNCPFVLNFIDDVNQLPANCQFVKRMGYRTHKPFVMCRPGIIQVHLL